MGFYKSLACNNLGDVLAICLFHKSAWKSKLCLKFQERPLSHFCSRKSLLFENREDMFSKRGKPAFRVRALKRESTIRRTYQSHLRAGM